MQFPDEAVAAALKAVFDQSQPWQVGELPGSAEKHTYRQANIKAVQVRVVRFTGRVYLSLMLDGEKADQDETEIPPTLVQQVVNYLSARMRPRPARFMVLGLTGSPTREVWWR